MRGINLILVSENSSTMEQGRRRRFINFVNRNLERVLAVNTPIEGRVENVQEIDNILFEEEENQVINEEEKNRRILALIQLLARIPRGISRRLINNHLVEQIREAVRGLRIDQLPAAIVQQLNEIF